MKPQRKERKRETMSKALGKNPLLNTPPIQEEPVLTENDIAIIRAAQSDVDDFTTASFKIRKEYLKKLRDYAFTNRLEQKEALDQILGAFLDQIDDGDLMEYPEKPKKTRRKRG